MPSLEAFGWPTGVNPVSVAIARLDTDKAVSEPPVAIGKPAKGPRDFSDLPLSQQAALRFNDTEFWKFIDDENGNF